MKKVVIYPGRFQPMLNHHLAVYDHLKSAFPDAEVYIGTSDKTEEGSPFNFKEKQLIAQTQGIDSDKVLFARQPYLHTFYDQFDHEETQVIFAVGEKDIGTRFPLNNIDPETGLDMTVNPDKETGKHRPKYYQMINTIKDEPLPMKVRGYLYPVKNIEVEGEVASATAFRNAIKNSPDKESAKEVFSKQFKDYNEQVFNFVYNKLAGEKMSEDLNIMKQLAGLEVTEGAPIEFEDQVSVKDITFAEVSKSSSKLSIANRFPEGADVNDMDAKKEMYVKELLKSPVALLSEINERIMPDENGLAVSSKLNKILDGMREGGITDLEAEDKGFVMDLVKHSLKNMELEAGDNREFDPESGALESLDLDEIRSNYSISEDEMDEGKVKDMAMDQADAFYNKVSDIADKSNDIQKAIIDAWKDDAENPPVWALDDGARDELIDAGLIDAEPEEPEMEESLDPLSEPSREELEYERLMNAYNKGEEELAQELQISMEELDQEMTEYAMDHNLHMDDDRDEVVQGYIEDVVHNADFKDHGERDFDPEDAEMESIEELKKLAGIEEANCDTNEEKCPNCGQKKHILKACSSCGCS